MRVTRERFCYSVIGLGLLVYWSLLESTHVTVAAEQAAQQTALSDGSERSLRSTPHQRFIF